MATVDKRTAAVEAVKEVLRLVVIGAVSGALAAAVAFVTSIKDPYVAVALGGFLTVIGRAWDKYLHKTDTTDSNGLVGF